MAEAKQFMCHYWNFKDNNHTEKTRHVWITIGTVVSFLVFRNTPMSPLLDRIYIKQKVQFPELHISKLPQSFLMYLFIKGESFEVVGGHRFFLLWSLYMIDSDIKKFTCFSHPQPNLSIDILQALTTNILNWNEK